MAAAVRHYHAAISQERRARRRRAPLVAAFVIAALLANRAAAMQPSLDRIFLVSTRPLGTRCDPSIMAGALHCERYVAAAGGLGAWQPITWSEVASEFADPLPTVVYVHGNRINCGEDKSHGLTFYRSLAACKQGDSPLRYVIWSWPSEQIRGPVKDYQVKAARTRQVGWQLAWAVDQLPEKSPLALVGYSFGARVVTGALHLLAGGEMDGLTLPETLHPRRPPMRAALVAAAVDADWLRPRGYHGRALEQVDELLLVNNQRDPAMRFYHLPMDHRARPLGFSGPASIASLGELASRVRSIDFTGAVGRHHALSKYLATSKLGRVLEQVVQAPATHLESDGALSEAAIAGREPSGELQ